MLPLIHSSLISFGKDLPNLPLAVPTALTACYIDDVIKGEYLSGFDPTRLAPNYARIPDPASYCLEIWAQVSTGEIFRVVYVTRKQTDCKRDRDKIRDKLAGTIQTQADLFSLIQLCLVPAPLIKGQILIPTAGQTMTLTDPWTISGATLPKDSSIRWERIFIRQGKPNEDHIKISILAAPGWSGPKTMLVSLQDINKLKVEFVPL